MKKKFIVLKRGSFRVGGGGVEATFIIFLKEKISFEQAKFEIRNKPLFLKKGFRKEFIFFFLFFFFFFF